MNSAGVIGNGGTADTSREEWERIMSINLDGTVLMCEAALPALKEAEGASIVNVSSVTGARPFAQITAYCVSKAAVDMYTRCLALEVAPHGIRVNAIAPGVVVTNLHTVTNAVEDYDGFLERSKATHPLGFVGEGKDIAALTLYLASDESRWATGGIYPLDGGRGEPVRTIATGNGWRARPTPAMLGTTMPSDYDRVERAIRFLDDHHREQPSLADVADAVALSEGRMQRLFRRWAGVSPKRFVQFATAEHARAVLRETGNVLDAAMETGLSGPGRLHDLTVNVHALTPGEIRAAGEGVEVRYGTAASPFGPAFFAWTERGVSAISFEPEGALDAEQARWPAARFRRASATDLAARVFEGGRVTLQLRGTNFQVRVWEALLRIPEGRLVTYGAVANSLGTPTASRAVGTAVGANPVAFLVPCHRVLRTTGALGGYRWGPTRKRAILAWEAARNRPRDPSAAR